MASCRLQDRIAKRGFQGRVLQAIFNIEERKGTLHATVGSAFDDLGFASRKDVADEMGLEHKDGILRLISLAGWHLHRKGMVVRTVIARPGLRWGATRFVILPWVMVFSETYNSGVVLGVAVKKMKSGVESISRSFQDWLNKRDIGGIHGEVSFSSA